MHRATRPAGPRVTSTVGFVCALALGWLAPLGSAHAVVTATWTVDSYTQWDKGEAESALITSLGEVKAGWETERAALEVDGVWAALRTSDGALLLGTDDDGGIYVARGANAQPSKLVSIAGAVAVVSLARGDDGRVYAGTMPGGEIWQVDVAARSGAKDGKGRAKKLASLGGAETVWALAMGAAGKTLYAGTGPEGKLFAVDVASGKAKEVFATGDKRITALVATDDGAVWLGTSDKALVFRYDPKSGEARAIADFSGNEISALAAAGGAVIVAANDFDEPSTSGIKTSAAVAKAKKKNGGDGEEAKMPDKGEKPGADRRPTGSMEPERKRARKGKGALFRVRGDGSMEQLHALTATYFTDIVVTETGTIFAGAGDKGRVYLVDTDDSVSTAFDVEERIIAALVYDPEGGLVFATSDAAAVYRTKGQAKAATYVSEVFDAKAPARFGKMVWHAGGAVTVATRTGNTAEPGIGWSEFVALKKPERGGGGARTGRIASPSGRYIQFRVSFTKAAGAASESVLRKTTVYYLPQNRATRVTEIEIKPSDKERGVTLNKVATKPRSPILKVDWTVDNPDGDETRYKLEVRRDGDALWRSIIPGDKPVTKSEYSWNTETYPDGYYRLRVTAIDDRENSADRARATYKTTGLFLLDNEKPVIDGVSVSYPAASARAVDAMSAIAEMAYSVDDGRWHVGATGDGLFDDLAEMLPIRLPGALKPGMHTLAIRVADEAGNIGSASVTFRVQ